MLTYLTIENFAIIEQQGLEFRAGTTVLTGETGAGKSIIMDALHLALGGRSEISQLTNKQKRCEISASFNIEALPMITEWLTENEFLSDNDCIIRRTITPENKSRCFINGRTATVQQLKQLGQQLVSLHDQHQQFTLLEKDNQRDILDSFANLGDLKRGLAQTFKELHSLENEYQRLQNALGERSSQLELINFQLQELEQLNYQTNEWQQLNQEFKQLNNAEDILKNCQLAWQLLENNEESSLLDLIKKVNLQIEPIHHLDNRVSNAFNLLMSATIELQEASHELQNYVEDFELNPEKVHQIETRLQAIHNLTRKHHIHAEELPALQQTLLHKQSELINAEQRMIDLQQALMTAKEKYHSLASKLSSKRATAAKELATLVTSHLPKLGMKHGKFVIHMETLKLPSIHGQDKIEFMLTTNAGVEPQPLAKTASGGELSRVCLIIYLIAAELSTIPTLIFDEVDVGISGGTAANVGQLLRKLGKRRQVLCITHLPQVAACGHHHLYVAKSTQKNQTQTIIEHLDNDQRIEEIARLLGGLKITPQTRANAKELLEVE